MMALTMLSLTSNHLCTNIFRIFLVHICFELPTKEIFLGTTISIIYQKIYRDPVLKKTLYTKAENVAGVFVGVEIRVVIDIIVLSVQA